MLIDDNDADNEFHSRIIRKADACEHIQVADSGQKALDYLQKCGEPGFPKPDLIFLDINMPKMNGFEFLKEYDKLDAKMKSKIVVFMLTSSLIPEDKDRAMKGGEVMAFLNKPLTAPKVREIVDKYF